MWPLFSALRTTRTATPNLRLVASCTVQVDPHLSAPGDIDEAKLARLKKRRDSAGWYAVAGTGMLFMGSFSTGLAVGGVLMVSYGALGYLYWGRRITKLDDPWDDDEVDAWEDEHLDR